MSVRCIGNGLDGITNWYGEAPRQIFIVLPTPAALRTLLLLTA
jgi:hypothetical protein